MQGILDFIGVDSIETWNAMSVEERRAGHDKVADAFESYLFEGKAPSPGLNETFRRSRPWFSQAYKNLRGLGVLLSNEVRGIFDSLRTSEQVIKASNGQSGFQPLFASAEEADMTESEWARYQAVVVEDDAHAQEKLGTRILGNMQWQANAQNKPLQKLQLQNQKKRKVVEMQVTKDISSYPVYRLRSWLQVTKGGKLSREILQKLYGNKGDAVWKQLPADWFALEGDEGKHPDRIAESFGFSSGGAMIQELVDSPPLNEAVEQGADQRMQELYGDLKSLESQDIAVNEAVHNEARTKRVHMELRALSKRVGSGDIGDIQESVAIDSARKLIAQTRVREMDPKLFIEAERRAARKALDAMRKGHLAEALAFKKSEVLNHHYAREALKARGEIENGVQYLNTFNQPGTRKTFSSEYLAQVDSHLERYEIRQVPPRENDPRTSHPESIRTQEESGWPPDIAENLFQEDTRQRNFKDIPFGEFMRLRDTVKSIEDAGTLNNEPLPLINNPGNEELAFSGVEEIEVYA